MIVFLLFSGVKFTEFIWVLLFFLPLEVQVGFLFCFWLLKSY